MTAVLEVCLALRRRLPQNVQLSIGSWAWRGDLTLHPGEPFESNTVGEEAMHARLQVFRHHDTRIPTYQCGLLKKLVGEFARPIKKLVLRQNLVHEPDGLCF